jgi:hypothetical protein
MRAHVNSKLFQAINAKVDALYTGAQAIKVDTKSIRNTQGLCYCRPQHCYGAFRDRANRTQVVYIPYDACVLGVVARPWNSLGIPGCLRAHNSVVAS